MRACVRTHVCVCVCASVVCVCVCVCVRACVRPWCVCVNVRARVNVHMYARFFPTTQSGCTPVDAALQQGHDHLVVVLLDGSSANYSKTN